MKNRSGLVLLSLAVSLAAVACSGPESPSSPASTAVSPANSANGSDGAGTTGAATATVTGTIRAFGGSCPALAFTLEGKTIKTDATTSFADVTCASLKNEVRVTVAGTTQADGSVRATTVRPAPALAVPVVPPAPSPVTLTITGTIKSFTGTCALVTFTLEGKTIKTNATTSFGDVACTALKNDARVTVVGTTQADGSVLATTVRPAPALPVPTPPAPVPPTATSVTITGTIHGLAAGCPTLTFTLEGKTIKTSAATSFVGGTCTALANDIRVTVVGTTQGDGSVLATEVRR
jgi:Domain of unknown function (DUF5666)